MRVTLAQIAPKLNRSNLDDILEIVQQYKEDSELIVFPELALSGYMLQDKLFEDAWQEGELHQLCDASYDVDIAVGAAMRDGKLFRNTALYFSQGKLYSQHIKVHLPNYGMFEEARYFEGGDRFESFTVHNKRIVMVICEDLWHENVHDELMQQNPDIIIALVASPARGFGDDSLEIEQNWYSIIQKVAQESQATLLFVNRVGFEDGLGFWGGSCVVSPQGERVITLEKFEKQIEVVEVSL